jgi:dihydroflavonol-4-reductase
MRVLITGAFGFLGRHLVDDLLAVPGLDVVAADVQASPAERRPGVTYAGGVDILSPESIGRAVSGADAVIHLAGLVSFWSGDKARLFEVNQTGTRNVADACAGARVKRLVHVSSVAAIGFNDREDEPIDETFEFDWSGAQDKHYMLSKRASEGELVRAADKGVAVVTANPGALYGPGDRTNVGLFQAVAAGRLPLIFPGGTNVVDARDVARGLRLLLLSGHQGERFILGGHNLRFTEIVRTISRATGVMVSPRVVPRGAYGAFRAAAAAFERLSPKKPALTADHVDSAFRFRYFSSAKAALALGWRLHIPFAHTCADAALEMGRAGLLKRAA